MAGFFYARAGPRPIILIKEVLDYQVSVGTVAVGEGPLRRVLARHPPLCSVLALPCFCCRLMDVLVIRMMHNALATCSRVPFPHRYATLSSMTSKHSIRSCRSCLLPTCLLLSCIRASFQMASRCSACLTRIDSWRRCTPHSAHCALTSAHLMPPHPQYFVKRTVQREGGSPIVVQANWLVGSEAKRHRFRESRMWALDDPAYFERDVAVRPLKVLRYQPQQPGVSGLLRETSALRMALRIALLLGRVLLLPNTCAFTTESGLVPPPPLVYRDRDGFIDDNVLDDTVDADWCTVEWFYDIGALHAEFAGHYREAAFLSHPRAANLSTAIQQFGTPPIFFIQAKAQEQLMPPPPDATVFSPADLERGPTAEELRSWLAPYDEAPLIEFGDLAGRIGTDIRQYDTAPGLEAGVGVGGAREAGTAGQAAASDMDDAALTRRLERGVMFREEVDRHVRQQVLAASPFDCLCVQGDGIDLHANLSAIVRHFSAHVPRDRTVFIAGHRMDIIGLDAFRDVWDQVYALALYDWNGSGLQGRQFSSTINRLICRQAEKVHSWNDRVVRTRECW